MVPERCKNEISGPGKVNVLDGFKQSSKRLSRS